MRISNQSQIAKCISQFQPRTSKALNYKDEKAKGNTIEELFQYQTRFVWTVGNRYLWKSKTFLIIDPLTDINSLRDNALFFNSHLSK